MILLLSGRSSFTYVWELVYGSEYTLATIGTPGGRRDVDLGCFRVAILHG